MHFFVLILFDLTEIIYSKPPKSVSSSEADCSWETVLLVPHQGQRGGALHAPPLGTNLYLHFPQTYLAIYQVINGAIFKDFGSGLYSIDPKSIKRTGTYLKN